MLEKMCLVNTNQQEVGVPILTSQKVDFREKNITSHKEDHSIMKMGVIKRIKQSKIFMNLITRVSKYLKHN